MKQKHQLGKKYKGLLRSPISEGRRRQLFRHVLTFELVVPSSANASRHMLLLPLFRFRTLVDFQADVKYTKW